MKNLSDYFDVNQVFQPRKYLADKTGIVPDVLSITHNDVNKNVESLSNDDINQLFKYVTKIDRVTYKYTTVNEKDKLKTSLFYIIVFTEHDVIYTIKSDEIAIYTTLPNREADAALLNEVWNKIPDKKDDVKESVVNLVGYSSGTYYLLESKIKTMNQSIEENYNDDFKPIYDDVVKFIDSRDSGLVLFFGKCGSGKTSIIRHLCYNHPKDYIIVPTSLTNKLGDPDFVSFMIDNSNSVFILEDCEQVLMDRNTNMFNGAISNILNMSDGLLSDILNIKFICTFNADISSIDSALLRKGRCFAKYEFGELTEDKVRALNEKYNLGLEEIRPMTLAEIYHKDSGDYAPKKRNKIGF